MSHLLVNQNQTNYSYTEMNQLHSNTNPIEHLFNFFNDKISTFATTALRRNPLMTGHPTAPGSPIKEMPDNLIFHIWSFLKEPKDFSLCIRTDKSNLSLSVNMPDNLLRSDSLLPFLYSHQLFQDIVSILPPKISSKLLRPDHLLQRNASFTSPLLQSNKKRPMRKRSKKQKQLKRHYVQLFWSESPPLVR